ncbi:ATPase family associated with various cellular activities (AAA) [[Eubacterium] yurii subsp. margaretiae ATCC 43715]|nr:ATPase family associated with various cellular activities (AAA) [[Eubacterium] yurii subsp. margaretiae ATCC 43715]
MRKCSECKENAAVLFIQDLNDRTKLRGLCLSCAKKLNIPGIDNILNNAGIDIDNVDDITEQMNEISQTMEEQFGDMDSLKVNEILGKISSSNEFKSMMKKMGDIIMNQNNNYPHDKEENKDNDKDTQPKSEEITNAEIDFSDNLFDNKFNKSEESTAKDENNQDSNNDETKNENQDLDVTVIKNDDAQVVKDNDDEGLIDIASFENELKKMFGGKNGFFEINVSSMPNMFGDSEDVFSNSSFQEDTAERKNSEKANPKKKNIKNIEKFSINLTQRARDNQIDPVIGRQKEIDRVIQILNRRTKNNPVLIGEPGVGKTAIAEGLAYKIVKGEVPQKLLDYEIMQLDMSSIVAGTQFRGQFETRMKNIIEEARKAGNVILVIDEIHSIMGAGDSQGTMDAANILKPALAKGDIQIIGATTINEYKKHIEKDKALERRLQSVLVEEPTIQESIDIVKGLKDYYENYHKILLSDEVIEAAVKLSSRYITDRYLPDKAIDIIDEVGSKANLGNKAIYEIQSIKDSIETLKKNQETATENNDYEKVAMYKTKELNLEEELKNLQENEYLKVTVQDVADVIEQWTKIPVKEISVEETQKLMDLEKRLKETVVGQDRAIEVIAKAIRRNRAGISAVKKPSSFIFVGPTGVGKTQLVKSLAKDMFGSEDMIIRVDMSEYMEKHSVSKLVGAPPGYVGFDEGGQLTDRVKRKPYSIILFDEIEKAHPDVFNMLLQILDEGRLTDSQGGVVHFENTVIVMTSNIGTTFKNQSLGFGAQEEEYQREEQRVHDAMKENFKPEFLNRIDEIVVFNRLSKDDLRKIVDIMISQLQDVVKDKGISIKITDEVKDFIVEKGYDEKYGARPLRRVIQKYIEDEISDIFIMNDLNKVNVLTLQLLNKKIMVEKGL